jgi:hypothetical protein
MRRFLLFALSCALAAGISGRLVEGIEGTSFDHCADSIPSAPASDVPLQLREVWLRFHEAELCQGVDAVFVFHKKGMEVWCRVEDEKSYRKFMEMLEPLRASYQIDLYATRPTPEKMLSDPPPSLLENAELRAYLQDHSTPSGSPTGGNAVSPHDLTRKAGSPWVDGRPGGSAIMAVPFPTPNLKECMLMFAEQTLDWNKKMERYADDLPALALVGTDPTEPLNLRSRAMTICLEHSQKLDKYAGRLDENLIHALPKTTKLSSLPSKSDRSVFAGMPPIESAIQISDAAHSAARRIYRFLYPQDRTVGMVDLREPGLLESLKTLRRMATDFQSAISKMKEP